MQKNRFFSPSYELRKIASSAHYACGKPIGGGYKHCRKCKIYFCWYCGYALQNISNEYPVRCPMCGEELGKWWPRSKLKRQALAFSRASRREDEKTWWERCRECKFASCLALDAKALLGLLMASSCAIQP